MSELDQPGQRSSRRRVPERRAPISPKIPESELLPFIDHVRDFIEEHLSNGTNGTILLNGEPGSASVSHYIREFMAAMPQLDHSLRVPRTPESTERWLRAIRQREAEMKLLKERLGISGEGTVLHSAHSLYLDVNHTITPLAQFPNTFFHSLSENEGGAWGDGGKFISVNVPEEQLKALSLQSKHPWKI